MLITSFAEYDGLETKVEDKTRREEGEGGLKTNLAAIGHTMIVSDVMKKPIITVKATDDLANTAQIMADKKISGLPVINSNSSNDLAGIITKTDIVKALIESNY